MYYNITYLVPLTRQCVFEVPPFVYGSEQAQREQAVSIQQSAPYRAGLRAILTNSVFFHLVQDEDGEPQYLRHRRSNWIGSDREGFSSCASLHELHQLRAIDRSVHPSIQPSTSSSISQASGSSRIKFSLPCLRTILFC